LDDLGSEMKGTGTNTGSGIKLKSSLDSRVGFDSRIDVQIKEMKLTFFFHQWNMTIHNW